MSNANVLCASEGVSQMNAGEKSLGVVIRAVSGGVILINERSYLQRKKRGYLCPSGGPRGPVIDGVFEYMAA